LDESEKKEKKETEKKYRKLLDLIKDHIDDVKEVRLSGRLKDSACRLVGDDGEMNLPMENILKSMGKAVPERKRVLEINPSHPIFIAMNKIFEENMKNELLREYTDLLYGQALLLEGSKPKDSTAFSKAISKLMVENIEHVKL
jgi:molecular chaperone HtpG